MPKAICSIEDCPKVVQARGWCDKHYARWRYHGDPNFTPTFAKTLPCSAEGCERLQQYNGYCQMHDRRVKKFGSPEGRRREKKPCAGPECPHLVSDRSRTGLCPGHSQQRARGVPLKPLRTRAPKAESCGFPGCASPVKSRGFCAGHLWQLDRGQELRAIKTPNREWGPCSVDGCEQARNTAGYCERHYASKVRRWGLYGITAEQGQDLYLRQHGACAICKRHGDIDDFHVDHDHSCCASGTRGCGRCVRGLLCSRCNHGLGYFSDDPERLRAAADYLT